MVTRHQLEIALPELIESGEYNGVPDNVAADAPQGVEMSSPDWVSMASEIEELMKEGILRFKFFRVTYGTSRNALGTLNPDLFFYVFRGGEAPKKPGLIRYWDVVRGGWRSFYLKNVEKFDLFQLPD